MSDTTKSIDDALRDLLFELKDAVWCSRGDNAIQNAAAQQRATKAEQAITQLFTEKLKEAEIRAYDDGFDAGRSWTEPSVKAAVEFRQEQYGLNDSQMAAILDLSKPHFSEFKHGKRGLPLNSIRKAYAIGIPASVLLQEIKTTLTQDTKGGTDDTPRV